MSHQLSFFDGQYPLQLKGNVRLIELFAGIGSQAKALRRLGVPFEHHVVCEFDEHAITSYNAIHGTSFSRSDIRELQGKDLAITDTDRFTYVLTYSFPCQDLSICGRQLGMSEGGGTRSSLLWEVKRLLLETDKLPQILVMENVPQVAGEKNLPDFMRWVHFLNGLGYTSKWEILNARDYGVPQNRERCFMVSWLGDYYYDFPEPRKLRHVLRDLLEPEDHIPDKYYLSDRGVKYVLRRVGKYTQICDENTDVAPATLTAVGNANWTGNFIKCEKVAQLEGIYESSNRVYSPDGLCPTLNAHSGGGLEPKIVTDELLLFDVYNSKQIPADYTGTIAAGVATNGAGTFAVKQPKHPLRKLTPLECWRLMGFLDLDYENAKQALNDAFFKGKDKSDAQLYRQAGNSIVVDCLTAIFGMMIKEVTV